MPIKKVVPHEKSLAKGSPFSDGVQRNCLTCGKWSGPLGWRKHPFRNYVECKTCAEGRQK